MEEKERENSRYKLKEIIDNTITDMNIYIENMFEYLDKITKKA